MPEVAKYQIGNTVIRIMDDACRDKTPAQVDEILQRISRLAAHALVKPISLITPTDKSSSVGSHS